MCKWKIFKYDTSFIEVGFGCEKDALNWCFMEIEAEHRSWMWVPYVKFGLKKLQKL